MADIFISYRRQGESPGYAQAIADRLKDRFGGDELFRDIDDIEPGRDFVEVIHSAVAGCKILLAVIGPDWLTVEDSAGRPRLNDPNDFVRVEVAAALERGVRVIPLLVGGAEMPARDRLPDDLKALAQRQAHELSEKRWNYDIRQLITVLEAELHRAAVSDRPDEKTRRVDWRKWPAVIGAVAAVVALSLAGLQLITPGDRAESTALVVEARPPEALVFLDDQMKGGTADGRLRIPNVEPGHHLLRVERDGFLPWEREVEVERVSEAVMVAELEPVVGEAGALVIESHPRAVVFVNGEQVGVTDDAGHLRVELPPGAHHLAVDRDGSFHWEGEVSVQPGVETPVVAAPGGAPPEEELIREYEGLLAVLAPLRDEAHQRMSRQWGDPEWVRKASEYYRDVEHTVIGQRILDFPRDPERDASLREFVEQQTRIMKELDPGRGREIDRFRDLQFTLLLPRGR